MAGKGFSIATGALTFGEARQVVASDDDVCARCGVYFPSPSPAVLAAGAVLHPHCFICAVCCTRLKNRFRITQDSILHVCIACYAAGNHKRLAPPLDNSPVANRQLAANLARKQEALRKLRARSVFRRDRRAREHEEKAAARARLYARASSLRRLMDGEVRQTASKPSRTSGSGKRRRRRKRSRKSSSKRSPHRQPPQPPAASSPARPPLQASPSLLRGMLSVNDIDRATVVSASALARESAAADDQERRAIRREHRARASAKQSASAIEAAAAFRQSRSAVALAANGGPRIR
ncbi:uncharacterized protein AMSG_02815 [Thecamonas trahens ATCC 50062]|uniref:LIM zinc-binding domain-containing protein n=1 Tax=Thecamonas trahens ATCC 50062 TaxID=461836 RepID=A0A0L0D4Y3_THETB|nr:hypothetical protein AMSG_02815 [Thecamonas trahens ATCC 50062]KNC46363.1 hypothetical protein AMSG_02815 [Thecamonas trahens ATCC 50062]|eukprot:XP_013760656.1 hypothetical protein AMSG_02815 [Thecamonas trahens ATCC 50062]